MRKPPFVLYGKVNSDSQSDSDVEKPEYILLESGDREAASYVIGSNPEYGDYYVLEIPVDDIFHEADAARIYVDDLLATGNPIWLGGMGEIRRHDIYYTLQPKVTLLLQNYPNPFNPETWIPYQLAEDADVFIMIYTLTGQLVRAMKLGHKPAGFYLHRDKAAYWDGKNQLGEPVASGVYAYAIQAGYHIAIKKMVVTH